MDRDAIDRDGDRRHRTSGGNLGRARRGLHADAIRAGDAGTTRTEGPHQAWSVRGTAEIQRQESLLDSDADGAGHRWRRPRRRGPILKDGAPERGASYDPQVLWYPAISRLA